MSRLERHLSADATAKPIATDHRIPNRIHFIWLGKSALPMRYLWNILSCYELNSAHYEINLWVNPSYFSEAEKEEHSRYDFLKKKGIKLRNYKDLSSTTSDDDEAFLLNCIDDTHLKRPVIAADALRIEILTREGGLYYDTDTQFKKALPESIICSPSTTLIIDETVVDSSETKKTHSFCNSFIASTPGGREIRELMHIITRNLRSLVSYGAGFLDGMSKSMILKNTGPSILDALCKLTRLDSEEKHCTRDFSRLNYPELRGVKSHVYDGTWSKSPSTKDRSYDWVSATALQLWQRKKLNREKMISVIDTGGRDESADSSTTRTSACSCVLMRKYC